MSYKYLKFYETCWSGFDGSTMSGTENCVQAIIRKIYSTTCCFH